MILAAEKALKDTKEQIKIQQRQARLATNLDEQHEVQKQIQKLEKTATTPAAGYFSGGRQHY